MNGVSEKTLQTWQRILDPGNRWLQAEIIDGHAVCVWCALCTKHGDRLKGFRNFSAAFITGISGTSLKRDTLTKHLNTSAYLRAESLETGPLPVAEVLKNTAIGKSGITALLL